MATDIDDIIRKMMKSSPSRDFKQEWAMNLAGLWGRFGSKKFLGKKGMQTVKKSMQDTYVMMSMESDRIRKLKDEIKKSNNGNDEMDKVKIERASDQLAVSESKFSDLHLRYKFLSTIYAIQELSSGSKFMKKIDAIMKNRKNMEILQRETKASIMETKEIERNLDTIDTYLDAMKDGHSTDRRDIQADLAEKIQEKEEKDQEEDENGDVMLS